MSNNIEVVIWDFDGVIVESNHIREKGFREVLSNFPEQDVSQLLEFHNQNGGLSRYVKFRHFFEKIRGELVNEQKILAFAKHFSEIMLEFMTDPSILIEETNCFIKENHKKFSFHIASGSDQNELQHLCQELNIAQYFKTIEGSPTPKSEIVKNLMREWHYKESNTLLIGDAINDYEAAIENNIGFMGYNCTDELQNKSTTQLNLSQK